MSGGPGGRSGRSDTVWIGRVPVRKADFQAVLGVAAVLAAVAYVTLPLAVALAGAFAVAAVLGAYRSERKHRSREYRQLEALFSLFSLLPEGVHLPRMRGWAASPDFALLVASRLAEAEPERVLECGSGVSTVVAGAVLRELGRGTLVALEHDAEWAERTRRLVGSNGLGDFVEVRHAPLVERVYDGDPMRWYETGWLTEDDRFDAVIVDGPPDPPAARYPVIPEMRERLAPGSLLLVDDAGRAAGRRDLRRWSEEHPDLRTERVDTEKGAAVLRWPGAS